MFEPGNYDPILNNWFETELEYEGRGYAEFTNPKGWAKGHANVKVSETGIFEIIMQVEEYACEETLGLKERRGDLAWLLSGIKPQLYGEVAMFSDAAGWPKNFCSKFEITTDSGVFSVAGPEIQYQYIQIGPDLVRVHASLAHFDVKEPAKPEYWVLPLSNFPANPMICPPLFDAHPVFTYPLRFFSPPPVADDLSDEERKAAYMMANSKNNIIPFEFEQDLAFIEPLPDFKMRHEKLEKAETGNLITAVMVGPIGNHALEWPAAKNWLPIDVIHLLSLASGSLVGIPWIEFRAADGSLFCRIHRTGPLCQEGVNLSVMLTGNPDGNCRVVFYGTLEAVLQAVDEYLVTQVR